MKGPSRLRRRLATALVILGAIAAGLAFYPAPRDFEGDDATAGASPGRTGLDRAFPGVLHPASNPPVGAAFARRRELGRLLFFDPVLSGANDIACATCHHPDLGFGDGRALSMGKGGRGLGPERTGGAAIRRGAPSLWNAALNRRQFWDGRAHLLEDQARGPITSPDEMAEDPARLEQELRAIPEYVELFERSFGATGTLAVTFDRVVEAIAAFERTLISNRSPFDRFVAGDRAALTDAQRRGFDIFRSGKTRCFECHGLPTFANPDFKVLGVPEPAGAGPRTSPPLVSTAGAPAGHHPVRGPDLGRAEVTGGKAAERAFKVPTLRNVALTAPYMHNGALATLEDVLDFYGKGGGRGLGLDVPNIDDKIRPFGLSETERADLIAFLHALTDESALPEVPARVPSGLPVVPRLENPARARAEALNVGGPNDANAERQGAREPHTVRVRAGESIQANVLRARAGDTIEVEPGTYRETVTVDEDGVTLRGLAGPGGERPVLDGRGQLADAVIATGNRFTIEGFDIRRYAANGVQAQNARDVVMRDLFVDTTGLYGVYPVSCTGVLVERVRVTGVADAGIYVGQSRDIIVRDCEAYGNVTGIEIENSVGAVVERNHVHDNAGGILVFLLPNNPSKVARGCRVAANRVIANNHENFADKAAIVAGVPRGTGILIMAADETEVTGNVIQGNDSCGIALLALDSFFPKGSTFDVGPVPERTRIHGNTFADNGRRPAEAIVKAGLPGADILWDLSGWSNTFDEPQATRATPLLSARLPGPVRLGAWRLLGLAREAMGE